MASEEYISKDVEVTGKLVVGKALAGRAGHGTQGEGQGASHALAVLAAYVDGMAAV